MRRDPGLPLLRTEREVFTVVPEEAGIERVPFGEIASLGDADQEARRFLQVLSGQGHPGCVAFSCLNAAAILWIAGRCASLKEGVAWGRETIASGQAIAKLRQWAACQDERHGAGPARLAALLEGL